MRGRAGGLSVVQQAIGLRRRFPRGQLELGANRLTWTHSLQPSDISRHYRVRLRYHAGQQPKVWVLDDLLSRPGEVLPHTYADDTLCLYRSGDWDRFMQLADTIVPWTAEWLAHYEIWLVGGEWHGGGEWPPPRASDSGLKGPVATSKAASESATG
jgi:hypothetical protein